MHIMFVLCTCATCAVCIYILRLTHGALAKGKFEIGRKQHVKTKIN